MDAVNRRYHDMVKFARACEQAGRQGSVDEYLEQRMTGDIPAAALVQTGNDVLDAVLWGAMDRCRDLGVRLVPNVDPVDLGFIDDFDLCTIVGNALDNAVDAAGRAPRAEQREIKLRIGQASGMVFFRVENCYSGEVLASGGRQYYTVYGIVLA